MFTIKAVSQATGVSIETLRAWERRYRVVEPRRDPNGRRSYDPGDVIRLRKLREAKDCLVLQALDDMPDGGRT